MQSAKETASNIAASAKAGMEKTKATAQEKAEKMTTRDPIKKDIAEQRKEERIHQAELQKQEARHHNAATREAAGTLGSDYTTGTTAAATGHPTTTTTTAARHLDPRSGTGGGGYGTGDTY